MAASNDQSITLTPEEVQEIQNESQDSKDFVSVQSPGESSGPWEVVDNSQGDETEVEAAAESVVPKPVVHQHVHRHMNVRKTVLKDCGTHFHVNRSKKVFVTHVHHHHYLVIKHIHVYDNTGRAWFEFSTSSSSSSRSHGNAPDSLSRSSSPELDSAPSDSQ
eukprot:s486_g8.t1